MATTGAWKHALAIITLIVGLAGPTTADAAGRVALVVGNWQYASVPSLNNPQNDAADIAATLEGLGFSVTRVDNASFDAMRTALRDFSGTATGAEVALVFYAGHGIEIDGRNYLVPVDATLAADRDTAFEAVPLNLVIDAVSGAAGLKLVLLDACRDNPFRTRMSRTGASRSIGRGLSRVEPDAGTLVAYAAKEGTTAADGSGRNSPYTAALLTHLAEPGLEVSFLFRRVRDSVLAATSNAQEPFTYGSLPGREFYLNAAAEPAPVAAPPPDASAPASAPAGRSDPAIELAYWEAVSNSDDPALIESYLARFPDGVFVDLARARLAALEAAGTQPELPPAVETPQPVDVTLEVQVELDRLGCEPGTPDGAWGARSRAALRRYGDAVGLDPLPGEPDQALLDRLTAQTEPVCETVEASAPDEADAAPQGEALPATRTFDNPRLAGGMPLDICIAPFQGCKGGAAHLFCRRNGFRVASNFEYDVFPATRRINGTVCQPSGLVQCGGYTRIVCVR